jgi:hypothetical protein
MTTTMIMAKRARLPPRVPPGMLEGTLEVVETI